VGGGKKVTISQGYFPTLSACAIDPNFRRMGFSQALLFALLQLPDVGAKDHLCMRLHQENVASIGCLDKVGEKLGRTLHFVGAVVDDNYTKFRAITEYDDLLECCLSRGPPSIFHKPRTPPIRRKNKGGRPKKAKTGTD
jgi:hypothetical protein